MKNLSFILSFLVLVTNSIFQLTEAKSHRIVGGDSASIDQFKYQVSLQANGKHFCGGGIIGDRFVLTAAHCVINYKNDFVSAEITVLAGTVDYKAHTDNTVTRQVEKVYVHKEYNAVNPNPKVKFFRESADIAVLKLTEGFGLDSNQHLSKLKLPAEADSYLQYLNEKAVIAGFGLNEVKGTTVIPLDDKGKVTKKVIDGISYHKLKFATAKVVDNKLCSSSYKEPLYRSHLCAQVEQRDPKHPEGICAGDSGGPLVINGNTVIGVVASSSFFCAEDRYPAEYTRVTSFLPFIKNAVNDEKSSEVRVASYQLQKKYFGTFGTMRVLVEEI